MQAGDTVNIRALKSDGSCYRHWEATVESITDDGLVTLNRPGDEVRGPAGGWAMRLATRTFYWFERPYNLHEMYFPDGRLKQIYIHIASPARLCGRDLVYTDYELDVVKRPGQALLVRDEEEFREACSEYGYSNEFQCSCREAVDEALRLADRWHAVGPPRGRRPCTTRAGAHSRVRYGRRRHPGVRTETPATDSSTRNTDV
jgi:protein associated with RNAse G/E